MSALVALGSVRGAPGVTTASLLIAGAIERSLLVEADVSGGVLAARYGLGREPSLTTLAAEPSDEHRWQEHAQSAGGVAVLVGPDAPDTAEALWRSAGERLGTVLTRCDADLVVADLGRLGRRSPLVGTADLILLVARPTIEHLVTLSHHMPRLRGSSRARVGIVLAGGGPYRAEEVADALEVEVVGDLPDDPAAAEALSGARSSGWSRSRLARASVGLADTVARSARVQRTFASPEVVTP
ncbi:hypothetical protein PO878_17570 [Iamia majanohamensis]|uniref:MinD-like ATPase involved in chromosome partitioning or flagellar assembly n=1 Tax=Iamia majanohamensis TaxID=467976 RepID=A0AAE9Y4Q8_9ACTN|nr:hypothetical protein [Iamia majanohamensis]WCO66312.1 hypothetical protein PO878_17570 [Iamia majanohamensis]